MTMLTYPGVYVQEAEGPRAIPGVSTSTTAFVGFLKRGPVDEPTRVLNFADFERTFGGLDPDCETTFAVHQYFANGGSEAWIVRVTGDAGIGNSPKAAKAAECVCNPTIKAANDGKWGNKLLLDVAPAASGGVDRVDVTVHEYEERADKKPTIVRSFKIAGIENSLKSLQESIKTTHGIPIKVDGDAPTGKLEFTGVVGGVDPGIPTGDLGVNVSEPISLTSQVRLVSIDRCRIIEDIFTVVPAPKSPLLLTETVNESLVSSIFDIISISFGASSSKLSPAMYCKAVGGSASYSVGYVSGNIKFSITVPKDILDKIASLGSIKIINIFKNDQESGRWETTTVSGNPIPTSGNGGHVNADQGIDIHHAVGGHDIKINIAKSKKGGADIAGADIKQLTLDAFEHAEAFFAGGNAHFIFPKSPSSLTINDQVARKAYRLPESASSCAIAISSRLPSNLASIPTAAIELERVIRENAVPCLKHVSVKTVDGRLRIALTKPEYAGIKLEFSGSAAEALKIKGAQKQNVQYSSFANGEDGVMPTTDAKKYFGNEDAKNGLHALEKLDVFNLLCLPDLTRLDQDKAVQVVSEAARYCKKRFAFLLVDPPQNLPSDQNAFAGAQKWLAKLAPKADDNVAAYFPTPIIPDPTRPGRSRPVAPSGIMAGIYAATDARRGIWKAPAGVDAPLRTVQSLSVNVSDAENGVLNKQGLNVLRSFPVYGVVPWGARTLHGDDDRASQQWKYIPVRRLALHIENSLQRGLRWAVFEPNGEMLWAQIRLTVGAFMQELFRQGAFAGTTPAQAYFVLCDRTTTTSTDQESGICNVRVGFAPLRPAEFVVLTIQQMTATA